MKIRSAFAGKFSFLILCIILNLNTEIAFSQDKYEFDFDSEFTWEDLMNSAVKSDYKLLGEIDHLKKLISIQDARIIFKQLSLLESLEEVKSVSDFFHGGECVPADTSIVHRINSMSFEEGMNGLIKSAYFLSQVKCSMRDDRFIFKGVNYLPQPERSVAGNIEVSFDYEGAEDLLNYLLQKEISPEAALESGAFRTLFENDLAIEFTEDEFKACLEKSSSGQPLSMISKWIKPSYYFDMGGVSVYAENFSNVIDELKRNEFGIRKDISYNLMNYLPANSAIPVKVLFVFGKGEKGFRTGRNNLIISLEYFGDDLNYLIRFIQREIFLMMLGEIQLPVEKYLLSGEDRILAGILAESMRNGTANYVSAVGTETRPGSLLEKDFKLFNEAVSKLYRTAQSPYVDSLIRKGFSGDAPFNTMATQMAYIIESTIGRSALIESLGMGPVYFFSQYIEAYRDNPDRIRPVFTFSRPFENKIAQLRKKLPEKIVREALTLKQDKSTGAEFAGAVERFINASGGESKPADLLGGMLLLGKLQFREAKEYFDHVIEKSDPASKDAGELFYDYGAYKEAIDFFNDYLAANSGDEDVFVKRGICYFHTSEFGNAEADFEKALMLNSSTAIARIYLDKIRKNE